MKHTYRALITFIAALLAFSLNIAKADSKPPILPPSSHAYGKSYEEWSAAWLTWALSIPAASNPILDPNGSFAAVGQSGKVWFLAGTTGTGVVPPVVRTINVPSGTPLFFPIVNYFWVNTPEYGDAAWSPTQEAFARAQIADVVDTAAGLSLQIDGRRVHNLDDFRFKSTAAECNIPPLAADNIFAVDLINNPYHCVADGYWVLLPPLPVGSHIIHFRGGEITPTAGLFSLDVTYKINVKGGHKNHKAEMPLHP